MKPRHWWAALAAVLIGGSIAFSLRHHSADKDGTGQSSSRSTSSKERVNFTPSPATAARIDEAPDTVPPPHEVSAAPPLGFAPPPDNEPLPPPERMDELLKPEPAANR